MSKIVENGIIITDDDINFYGDTEKEKELNKELYHCCLDISTKDDEIKELKKENKALRQLLEWAIECDLSFDQIFDDTAFNWDNFQEQIEDMSYLDSMIYYAERWLEQNERDKGE